MITSCCCLLAQGVHYTERTRPQPPLLPPFAGLGTSTAFHDLEQLRQPWGPALDYAFLSPVFDSISKPDHGAACFDQDELTPALERCPVPIVALGGITAGSLGDIRGRGFAGAAVIGSVWQAEDPVYAYQELQRAWDAAERPT